ncbi:hypothetical protein [Jannaschia aquimarina]|uniref:Uncharacterized protein n=1 Tax=Jannaschia aquimarina TaxID=935700 RepID=A0A0D1CQA1_9RHOB|nr:hypothetical protein [Jannaschia aquimarina]KIT16942.1 hypothetical protein jaqu_14410 [Jannaschia aquimarina]SNT11090.1 hypothetical protein SAMN05421775_1067 [Jannaschia aquimarina]
MSTGRRDDIVDAITLLVGLWFLFGGAFADIRNSATDAVAIVVMAYAILRLIRRRIG